jgi:hypothetical protein
MVEHLPSKCKALRSNPMPQKRKKKLPLDEPLLDVPIVHHSTSPDRNHSLAILK